MDFYLILEQLMREKSLTIPDVARMAGLADSTVRSIISRKSKSVALEVAVKLSKGLGVSLEFLNGEENTKENVAMDNDSFGLRLREARKLKGLTQKELAERIGAKHNSVSNWENDQNKPDPDTIELICGELSITPNYLLKTNEIEFSVIEKEFISRYRVLDEHGKRVVDFILNEEFDRVVIPDNAISLLYFPDVISAGAGDYGSQEHQKINLPASKVHRKTDYLVQVKGIDMEPTYYEGDMLCVSRTIAPKVGDIGIFSVGGRNLIRELGNKKLIPHNSNVEDTPITPDVECKGLILSKIQ